MDLEVHRTYIRERIIAEGFRYVYDTLWLNANGRQIDWTFDLKHLFLEKEFLHAVCEIFWSIYDREKPIQIGGEEVASIPLVTALVLSGEKATGFYIRKSRKKKYDLRQLEGTLGDAPVVLVDDIINSGSTVEKQMKVLEKYHISIAGVFACVRLQPLEQYSYLGENGIRFNSIFNVTDFGAPYVSNRKNVEFFEEVWKFNADEPHLYAVERRPQLLVAESMAFLNADDGYVYALNIGSGRILWKTQVQRKIPQSLRQPSLVLVDGVLYVPTEGGVVYALRQTTGECLWKKTILDHIYGEPLVLDDRKELLVTGLESGRSYAQVLSITTGGLVWKFENTQRISSASFHKKGNGVLLGFDGNLKCFDADSGVEKWNISIEGTVRDRVSIDEEQGVALFVTDAGKIYAVDVFTGNILRARKVSYMPFLSAMPVIYGDVVYLTSLHRTVYALRKDTFEVLWEFDMKGRIFSRPTVTEKYLYIGNNEGILYAFERETGKLLGKFIATERFVSEPFIDEKTGDLIIATIANEVYRLKHTRASENKKGA